MLGRDKIELHFSREDGSSFSRTYRGVVVTENLEPKLEPFGRGEVMGVVYRLILPRTLNLTEGTGIAFVTFGPKSHVRLLKPFVAIFDGRGRVRHYEAVVRA